VEPILTANRIWRAKHTSPLTLAAEAWLAADRDPHKLYRGEQLKDAQAQAEAHPGELAELEKEFIDESLERARLESAKRQRLALFGTMGLLVVFLILAVWALYSAGQARVARDRSDQARATAEAASEIAIAEREEARFQRDRAAAAQAEAEAASETAIAEREEARIQRDRAAAAQADAEAARTEIQRLLEQKKYLSETGWGVIFAHDADPAVRQALSELLDHRREQATREQANYYKEYTASDGYRTGETAQEFLERQGASIGPVDPGEVPYYLLIVGDPESIPYEFQYQLDTKYAVGRIHFQELEDYENYARSVVQAESGEFELPRQVGMFSPVHEGERATELMYTALTEPLYQHLKQTKADWQVNASVKDDATKAQLARLLGGDQTPALLFNASHSVGFPLGDPRQITDQGAVVCQDWPFGGQGGGPAHYFSADDVDKDARLLGLIVFSFSEFGAGTPKQEDFWFQWYRERREIAPYAFVAPLPQRLLSHPAGGALAFIGHIENTWAFSVMQPGAATEREVAGTFSKAIDQLLDGYPVGAAMEPFDQRYAELAADLTAALRENEFKLPESDDELIDMLTMVTDARNYVIIGDPAVRLMVAEGTGTIE
jgi:hypothetical protein